MAGSRRRGQTGQPTQGPPLYAGVAEDGIYRFDGNSWTAVSDGLPAHSTILAFVADPRTPGLLWAARDGGGVYRSTDGGDTWVNVATGVGENLAQSLAVDFGVPDGVLMGTATAGVWALRPNLQPAAKATAVGAAKTANGRAGVDARIEVVWPHDFAPVTEADQANIGLRLFAPAASRRRPAAGSPRRLCGRRRTPIRSSRWIWRSSAALTASRFPIGI